MNTSMPTKIRQASTNDSAFSPSVRKWNSMSDLIRRIVYVLNILDELAPPLLTAFCDQTFEPVQIQVCAML